MSDEITYAKLKDMVSSGAPTEEIITGLDQLEKMFVESKYENFCPLDFKYHPEELVPYLTAAAEVKYCARVHAALMDGLREFGKATNQNVLEMEQAIKKVSPANVYYLEANVTHHDQIALIDDIGQHVSEDTKHKMHPGTTSYDILDTARALMYRDAMEDVFIPQSVLFLKSVVDLADTYADRVQIGRTHDQWTSPVTFGFATINYAVRIADRIREIQRSVGRLEGKISGIVGTRASPGTIVGKDNASNFEKYVLGKLGVKPCRAASQVTHKEKIVDLAHYIASLEGVLADLSNSFRHLQRSEVGEVTQADTKERLGGSSADPSKNNPIDFENVNGLWEDVIGGMYTMYHLQVSDHQRDLRGSVQYRFEPVHMTVSTYGSLKRLTRVLNKLMVIPEAMETHLIEANKYSISEAFNATLKKYQFPGAHSTVKKLSKKAIKEGRKMLDVALEDTSIRELWDKEFTYEEKECLLDIRKYYGDAIKDTRELADELRQEFGL